MISHEVFAGDFESFDAVEPEVAVLAAQLAPGKQMPAATVVAQPDGFNQPFGRWCAISGLVVEFEHLLLHQRLEQSSA